MTLLNDTRELHLTRELVLARELSKEKKKERYNDNSVAFGSTDSGMAEQPFEELQLQTALEGVEGVEGICSTPVRTSSRVITGITVQHNRPNKSTKLKNNKLSISVQDNTMIPTAEYVQATAELKVYSRMHEVRALDYDSEAFALLLLAAKEELRNMPDREQWFIGRLHERNKRSKWFPNCFAVGYKESGVFAKVMLYVDGQQFLITMDASLSHSQQAAYYSGGLYGTIVMDTKPVCGLLDMPRTKFVR
jgi:hypothetical protein